jgi:hypothetical protein
MKVEIGNLKSKKNGLICKSFQSLSAKTHSNSLLDNTLVMHEFTFNR